MNRGLVLLGISLFTWGIGEGMFFYIQPLYLEQAGASAVAIGGILGAMGIAMTLAHIPAGSLSDRLGPRALLWSAWIVALVAAWIMALASSLPVFVAGLLIYGTTAFVASPLNSYVTAARGQWPVGRALTVVMAFYNSGAIIGPASGGLIAGVYGLHRVYLVSACIFIVSTAIILMIPHLSVTSQHQEAKRSPFPWSKPYLAFLVAAFWILFAAYLAQPLASNYLQDIHHLKFDQIGQLGSLASAGIVCLGLILGRLKPQLALLAGQAAVGLFVLLLWRGNGLVWFAIGYFLLGGYRVARAMLIVQTRSFVQDDQIGLAYGITETVGSVAIIAAPILAGILYHQAPASVYPVSIGLIIVSLAIIVWINSWWHERHIQVETKNVEAMD